MDAMGRICLRIKLTSYDVFEQFAASYTNEGETRLFNRLWVAAVGGRKRHSQIKYQVVIILFLYAVVQPNNVGMLKLSTNTRLSFQLLKVARC